MEANIGIFFPSENPCLEPPGAPGAGAEASPHGQQKTLLQTPQNQNIPRQYLFIICSFLWLGKQPPGKVWVGREWEGKKLIWGIWGQHPELPQPRRFGEKETIPQQDRVLMSPGSKAAWKTRAASSGAAANEQPSPAQGWGSC